MMLLKLGKNFEPKMMLFGKYPLVRKKRFEHLKHLKRLKRLRASPLAPCSATKKLVSKPRLHATAT